MSPPGKALASGESTRAARPSGLELRWRLSLAIGLLLTAALAVAALVAVGNARVAVSREVDTSLRSATASLDLTLSLIRDLDDVEVERVLAKWVAGFTGARHLCVSIDTRTAPHDRCTFSDAPPGVPDWFVQGAEFSEPPVLREVPLTEKTVRVHLEADPRDELREAWVDVRSQLMVIGALAFAVNLCVFLTISFALRPLARLVRAMDQIGRGQRATELPRAGPPEVQRLSEKLGELEDRIARGREQVRSLHLRNLDLQEDERRMVARELHDEIGQHVTAIEMETIRVARMSPDEQAQREARLQQLRASVAEIHRVSRRLVGRLRPPSIESLGLVGALEGLLDRWREDYPDSALEAVLDPGCDRMPGDRAVHLYRIVQESLSNAARHAQAGNVWVRVVLESTVVRLRVGDDGRGFDPQAATRGYGLAGMRERTEALSGSFAVTSKSGAGTVIEAEFPLR